MNDIVRQVEADGRRALWWSVGGLSALLVVGCIKLGLYTIQPMRIVPLGGTYVVLRESDEPFFNSPDATCERRVGAVSLFCRMEAIGFSPLVERNFGLYRQVTATDLGNPKGRVLLSLRFQQWAYDMSVDGRSYER